jgi:hypothetical protein
VGFLPEQTIFAFVHSWEGAGQIRVWVVFSCQAARVKWQRVLVSLAIKLPRIAQMFFHIHLIPIAVGSP